MLVSELFVLLHGQAQERCILVKLSEIVRVVGLLEEALTPGPLNCSAAQVAAEM